MIIYRVETDRGEGPYANNDVGYACGSIHHAPTAWDDPGLGEVWGNMSKDVRDEFYFGFGSVRQLLEWFNADSFHEKAERKGFRVSVIEAAGEVFHGTYQSIFERSKSVVTQRLTFSQIKQLA